MKLTGQIRSEDEIQGMTDLMRCWLMRRWLLRRWLLRCWLLRRWLLGRLLRARWNSKQTEQPDRSDAQGGDCEHRVKDRYT